ncbi:hypothetical protein EK21DRAFT_90994 [Setomelanomma holmii]|uniref:DUF7932 domain-containing protein n=1 Tax=Setomelanomma holmii TaxID=210430 RepID=A0A9P4LKV9_9PLEO|nr:hypothetical protein EK21DRAFT_90994 [Setomelanomma holmii]
MAEVDKVELEEEEVEVVHGKNIPDTSRPSARSGCDGPRGHAPTSPMYPGNHGASGHGSVVVFDPYHQSPKRSFTSVYEFKLRDFDVTDENGDDIFEPGECVLTSALQVENTNRSATGMPTPLYTEIPATMRACSWLAIVHGREKVPLPRNIAPRQTKTTDGVIWAKIQFAPDALITNNIFSAEEQIHLDATIPDIEREVNNFDHMKTIRIQYPLFLEPTYIKHLECIPFGCLISIKWPLSNRSSKALGSATSSNREVLSSIETESSSALLSDPLGSPATVDTHTAEERITGIDAYQTHEVTKRLHIAEDAEEYSSIRIFVRLHATPATTAVEHDLPAPVPIAMQTHEVMVQVTNRYQCNPSAEYLILTSRSTTQETLEGWRRFIRTESRGSADVWNMCQYGSICEKDSDMTVLDNFEFQMAGRRKTFDFVDANTSSAVSQKHTSFIFAKQESIKEKIAKAKLSAVVLASAKPIHVKLLGALKPTVDGHRNSRSAMYGKSQPQGTSPGEEAKTNNLDGAGLIVLHCSPQGQMINVDSVGQRIERGACISGLNLAEAYTLVSGLPFVKRLDMLYDHVRRRQVYSDFIILSIKHSVLRDLHDQVTTLARRPRWSHTLFSFKQEQFTTNSLHGDIHDKLVTLFSHDICQPLGGIGHHDLSDIALELLSSVILSARCQSFTQLLTKIFNPFRRTRSHVKRGLLDQVRQLIESNATIGDATETANARARFKAFRKGVKQKLTKKSHGNTISQRITTLTKGQIQCSNGKGPTHAVPLDNAFPKTRYIPPKELEKWHMSHEQAKAQQLSDMALIASLEEDLDLAVYEETRPTVPEPPLLDAMVAESSLEWADEVAASPVPIRNELHNSERRATTTTEALIEADSQARTASQTGISHDNLVSPLEPWFPDAMLELPLTNASELPDQHISELRTCATPELPVSRTPELPTMATPQLAGAGMNLAFEMPTYLSRSAASPVLGGAAIAAAANRAFIAMLLAVYLDHATDNIPVEDVD